MCVIYSHYFIIPLGAVTFMRGIITTYKTYKRCLFHPHPWEGNTNVCAQIHFILLPGSCQTVPAIYVKFNALLCRTHTHTQSHTLEVTASTLKYVCIWMHMQIISVIHIRDALSKMKHQWKCQARNKHSNKDNSKDKQFPRFQMFLPLGVSLHMFCTQILLCTQHQHAHRRTNTHTHSHRRPRGGVAYQMLTYVTVQAFCGTACATLSHKTEI